MPNVFMVEMGEELYSLVAPDGTAGDPVEYGTTATLFFNNVLYYTHVDDPDEFPEGGEPPTVFRVDATTVVESSMEEVSDYEEERGSSSSSADSGEEEEEEEEDEEEDELPGPGDVIEFPEPEEEDEDENLPPAEGQR